MALTASQSAVLSTRMSAASKAMTLGRSVAWVERQLAAMAAEASPPAEPAPPPFVVPFDPTGVYAGIVDAEGAAPVPEPEPEPAALRAAEPRPDADLGLGDRRIEHLRPVTARVVGWARRFTAAGYSVPAIAGLFDRCPLALAEALAKPDAAHG